MPAAGHRLLEPACRWFSSRVMRAIRWHSAASAKYSSCMAIGLISPVGALSNDNCPRQKKAAPTSQIWNCVKAAEIHRTPTLLGREKLRPGRIAEFRG
jgi:hypothetical protein